MATSGTHSFTLDLAEVMEEAYERIGGELRSGYDYKTARRSLDLLMLEWQNKGLNLWTVKSASIPLVAGQYIYPLPADQLDVIEGLLRTNEGDVSKQTDLTMRRVSVSNYARQTNKLQQGRPTQYWIEHTPDGISVYLWQVPHTSDYVFNYYYLERIEDTGQPATNTLDLPARYLPALIAGLAYYLSLKSPAAAAMTPALKIVYDEQWDLASDAARDRSGFFVKPGGYQRI
jgi:hypothetical protein